MTFQWVPVSLAGDSEPNRSRPVSVADTINMYLESAESDRSPAPLQSWPGPKAWSAGSGGADRGLYEFDGVLYKVTDTQLFSIASDGTQTSIGTIEGTARCYFADNAGLLAIATGGRVYKYDKTTLAEQTDADFESPNTVAMINNQWIYDGGGTSGRFVVSDPGDPGAISSLNYATAEADGDRLLRIFSYGDRAYMFGEHTIQPYYNSGVGAPPFDPEVGGVVRKGLGAVASIASSDEFIFFFADDLSVYRMSGYQAQSVTDSAMADQFENYATTDDAIAFVTHWAGQDFYIITFPTAGKTWAYSQQLNKWYQLSSGTSGGAWSATSYAFAYNKHCISYGDDVLQLDRNTYTDNGDTWVRQRTLGPISGNALSAYGQRIAINKFRALIETGVGAGLGEGLDPDVMFSISSDGGRTFGNDSMVSMGQDGAYLTDVEYSVIKISMDFDIRMRVTDPVPVSFHAASALIDMAGY